MTFACSVEDKTVTLTPVAPQAPWLKRLFGGARPPSVAELTDEEGAVAMALADLRELAGGDPTALTISPEMIRLSHDLVSRIDSETGAALGLPRLVDYVFKTDVEGLLGNRGFRLAWRWERRGQPVQTSRTGAILQTPDGPRRLPSFLMRAIEIADAFDDGAPLAQHWAALARFRRTLEPDAGEDDRTRPDVGARAQMTEFLAGLKVRMADAVSLSPFEGRGGLDFDPTPFTREALDRRPDPTAAPEEADAELHDAELRQFQREFRRLGAAPAYRLGESAYIVMDEAIAPVLSVMAQAQRADPEQREAFVRNPTPAIAAAVRARLEALGRLDGLAPDEVEAAVEAEATPCLVETVEFAERVIGVGAWAPPTLPVPPETPTTWLPEDFGPDAPPAPDASVSDALPAGDAVAKDGRDRAAGGARASTAAPVVLVTEANFFDVAWRPERKPRVRPASDDAPRGLRSTLMAHQAESHRWLTAAWRAGLPGVLNADEPGLGKTLQSLSFLKWLRRTPEEAPDASNGPMLVVAPTSLLQNWEAEAARHLDEHGLGRLVALYGGGLRTRRADGPAGVDTMDGVARLDLDDVRRACEAGEGDGWWVLTTYTTLTDYQHSLARLPFTVAVFDEIQNLKNPASLRAAAARAVNADFRIGLTGTPIENRTVDLWAIMDQLAPGALGSMSQFAEAFGEPTRSAMDRLHARVFAPQGDLPALGIRRLKTDAARDLPPKRRLMHPRLMPDAQARRYADARAQLGARTRGEALKVLHHIRTVSAHPDLGAAASSVDAFVEASARVSSAVEILDSVKSRGERALVFIEHTRLQHRFAEVLRSRFGLSDVPIINGSTPVHQRMRLVRRFQRHLSHDEGFDVIILAPKAAGVGLTLTAATHVIHLSRWWNPAVEEQCNDRAHRIGQTAPVTIHLPLAIHPDLGPGSFDCLLQDLLDRKRGLAEAALWPMADSADDVVGLEDRLRGGDASHETTIPARMSAFGPSTTIAPCVLHLPWRDGTPGGALVLDARGGESPDSLWSSAVGKRLEFQPVAIVFILAAKDSIDFRESSTSRIFGPRVVIGPHLRKIWPQYGPGQISEPK